MNKVLNINYEKIVLDNGLEVILSERKSIPLVSVNIWYKVGSANEQPTQTGFAHLFEHMMFQGSEHVKKEEHFKLIQSVGGTLNASTSTDRTNYFETLPSNNLELALWLESDRMGYFLPALTEEKLQNQKEVVLNERLQRYDNQPYGLAWEILFKNLFPENHPYSWTTIGSKEHIKNFKIEQVRDFFRKYYAPNNATMVICGEFDLNEAIDLTKRYFQDILPYENIPVKEVSEDHILDKNIQLKHYDKVQISKVYIGIPTVKIYTREDSLLHMLANILTGSKNSRLFRELVFKKQIAQDISSFHYSGKFGGAFIIVATAQPNISAEELSFEIKNEITNFLKDKITDEEMIRTKNAIKSSFIYSLQNISSLADQLNNYNFYLGEPNYFQEDLNRFETAEKEEIMETAREYLTKNMVELFILPEQKKWEI